VETRIAADRVFENQVPADDPGEEFAEGGVAISIGAASHWHERGEFAVAQRGEDGGQPGERERKHHRRTGILGRDGSGEHKDAGADNGPDAQGGEIYRTQRPMEALVCQRLGLQGSDGFASKQIHAVTGLLCIAITGSA